MSVRCIASGLDRFTKWSEIFIFRQHMICIPISGNYMKVFQQDDYCLLANHIPLYPMSGGGCVPPWGPMSWGVSTHPLDILIPRKGHGTRDIHPHPHSSPPWRDRHLWKHYLPSIDPKLQLLTKLGYTWIRLLKITSTVTGPFVNVRRKILKLRYQFVAVTCGCFLNFRKMGLCVWNSYQLPMLCWALAR